MAYQPNPNDPYRASDPLRADVNDDSRQSRLNDELRTDPELAERPANGGKVAMFAVAVAVVLGAAFYGLNNSSINHAGTSSTAQNSSQTSPPAAPAGMRDVTPRTNTEPGMTTGATPATPAQPPALAPTGAPADTAPASK